MSTISLAAHIFQELLLSLVFKYIFFFFFQSPHTGVPQSHHCTFKAIITSFQNACPRALPKHILERAFPHVSRMYFCPCESGFGALDQISDKNPVTFILFPPIL